MKQIIFRKIFERIESGSISNAIISYQKYPWMYHTRTLNKDEITKSGWSTEVTVIQHRYYLAIDLWFVVLRFYWSYPKLKEEK